MYYDLQELEQTIPHYFPQTKKDYQDLAKELADDLLKSRRLYKAYGPYWWTLKEFLKLYAPQKRAWFFSSYIDEDIKPFVRQAASPREYRLELWGALRYAAVALERKDPETPKEFHFLEDQDSEAFLYQLSDPDASKQLELFEAEPESFEEENNTRILKHLPSSLKNLGDQALAEEDFDLAIFAYRRLVTSCRNATETTEAWLRLAAAFLHFGHGAKAILCYQTLYEQDAQAWILNDLAKIYLNQASWVQAYEYYREALKKMPGNPEALWGYQEAQKHLKNQEELKLSWA